MFFELPAPEPLIAPPADQFRFHDPASFKYPVFTDTTHGAFAILDRLEHRKDRRSAPAHSDAGAQCPQPFRDLSKLGMLLEDDRFKVVRAERTCRHNIAPFVQCAHEGLEIINTT